MNAEVKADGKDENQDHYGEWEGNRCGIVS